MENTPILYSFRRCPYAMRARMAIAYAKTPIRLREIELRDKPPEMLEISPKGTVPVLQLSSGEILEESLDIMRWALSLNDPDNWLQVEKASQLQLIAENDSRFKLALDVYKYPSQYPDQNAAEQQQHADEWLQQLEQRLLQHRYLFADHIQLADVALFPFVRQYMRVDEEAFRKRALPNLIQWLDALIQSALFQSIMQKYPSWRKQQIETRFPPSA